MDLGDFTNIVLSATSLVAIVLGIATYWHQNVQANLFLGIQILREWEQSFFSSPEMRRRRHIASAHFRRTPTAEVPPEAWEILDAFDSIGIYVNRGIVDKEIAWITFYYWLNVYWHLLKNHTKRFHEYSDGVRYLNNVEELYKTLTDYGVKHRNLPGEDKRCSPEKIQGFLDDEIKATRDPEWE
jgi:hypothetical protein